MDKSRKLYIMALNKYQNGYIDKAIALCEEAISLSMKNNAVINLKGLLYYLKGDLEGARALWKLNYEVNNDEVGRKYLQGLKEDEERFSFYTSAVSLINELNVKEALNLLIKCKESDYNCINVNNAISTCYITLGQYDEAITYINKTLEIDKKDEIANTNRKNLIKNGIDKKKFVYSNNSNKGLVVGTVLCIFIGFSIFGMSKLINNVPEVQEAKNSSNIDLKSGIKESNMLTNEVEDKEKQTEAIKKEEENMKIAKQEESVNKGEGIEIELSLTEEEISALYMRGREEANENYNYAEAITYLSKAYDYGKNTYLYPHILYSLGSTYESKKSTSEASKYYSEYVDKFPKGNYMEEVLYRLVHINKDTNIYKAKEYAERLSIDYPNSQYNNSVIKSIINK